MKVKPAYTIEWYQEDFNTSGLEKLRELYELATDRPISLHQIEWPTPVLVGTILKLPTVEIIR